jgi:hypothetical protein
MAVEAAMVEPVDLGEGGDRDVVEIASMGLRVGEVPPTRPVEGLRHRVGRGAPAILPDVSV